jgi:cytochrome c oxidase subunit 4
MKTIGDTLYRETETPAWGYAATWLALLALLVLTWRMAYAHLGAFGFPFAMLVACAKTCLIMWFFMQLRSSPKIVLMFFAMALVMFFIAIFLTLTDYVSRGGA